MKISSVAALCLVAMATSEAFFLPAIRPFGAFPMGIMGRFPGFIHPGLAMPYPGYMGLGYGMVPAVVPAMTAAMPDAAVATAAPAAHDTVYDTVAAADPNTMGTYPVY